MFLSIQRLKSCFHGWLAFAVPVIVDVAAVGVVIVVAGVVVSNANFDKVLGRERNYFNWSKIKEVCELRSKERKGLIAFKELKAQMLICSIDMKSVKYHFRKMTCGYFLKGVLVEWSSPYQSLVKGNRSRKTMNKQKWTKGNVWLRHRRERAVINRMNEIEKGRQTNRKPQKGLGRGQGAVANIHDPETTGPNPIKKIPE